MPLKNFKSDLPKCVLFVSLIISRVINLEPLELRKLKNGLVMYFKCLNNLVALPSDKYFCQQNRAFHTIYRSGANRLMIPSCSTNHF